MMVRMDPHLLLQQMEAGGCGFMTLRRLRDELHAMALGIDGHIVGNVLWHFVFTNILGMIPRKEPLGFILADVCTQHRPRQSKSQLQSLGLQNIINGPN